MLKSKYSKMQNPHCMQFLPRLLASYPYVSLPTSKKKKKRDGYEVNQAVSHSSI